MPDSYLMRLRIARVRLETIPLGVKTKLTAARSLGQANEVYQ